MKAKILIIDDEAALGKSLQSVLEDEGYSAFVATTAKDGLRLVEREDPDVLICDIQLPDLSGLDVLKTVGDTSPSTQVVMITAYAKLESAIAALKDGARDYLIKPFLFDDLLYRVKNLLSHRELERETRCLRRSLAGQRDHREIVGKSPAIVKLRSVIERVASTNSAALIVGESGTGKELVAREIHAQSTWAAGQFVAVNCGALPETLMESELFGYRKGAFSGADHHKEGLIQLAHNGTLFLDEIGDLPLSLQPKLLRFLESKEFIPLGGTRVVRVATRVLAATNRDLARMVDDGSFRGDLLYRLNTFEIQVPSLAERTEDIPLLVNHMLPRLSRELGRKVVSVDAEATLELCMQPWRGNVRELENVIQRAIILSNGDVLTCRDLFPACGFAEGQKLTLRDAVREFERRVILNALERNDGDKRKVAHQLGISLASVYAKLQEDHAARIQPSNDNMASDSKPAIPGF